MNWKILLGALIIIIVVLVSGCLQEEHEDVINIESSWVENVECSMGGCGMMSVNDTTSEVLTSDGNFAHIENKLVDWTDYSLNENIYFAFPGKDVTNRTGYLIFNINMGSVHEDPKFIEIDTAKLVKKDDGWYFYLRHRTNAESLRFEQGYSINLDYIGKLYDQREKINVTCIIGWCETKFKIEPSETNDKRIEHMHLSEELFSRLANKFQKNNNETLWDGSKVSDEEINNTKMELINELDFISGDYPTNYTSTRHSFIVTLYNESERYYDTPSLVKKIIINEGDEFIPYDLFIISSKHVYSGCRIFEGKPFSKWCLG